MPLIKKMKSYETFSDWKKDQTAKNKKLITEASKLISTVAPKLETTVKWGQGCWTEDKNHKVFIHCAPDHIQLGFYTGSTLQDPKNLLKGSGKFVKHVKIFSVEDIDKPACKNLIKQVV
jgi:hypothetical protein